MGTVKDTQGIYALHFQHGSLWAYVVGRNAEEYNGEIVSTQKTLISLAMLEDKPIVMYSKGDYLVFDPKRINLENFGQNRRLNQEMVNFSINLAQIWDGQPLEQLWAQVKIGTAKYAQAHRTLLDFGEMQK